MKANPRLIQGLALTLLSLLFASLALMAVPVSSMAQAPYQWSVPKQIPEYSDLLWPPLMVADRNRTVHAFNMERVEDNLVAVMYRTWSLDQGWSSPLDIILPTDMGGVHHLLDVILDERGYFHLLFYSGAQWSGSVYYSSALASDAEDSSKWSNPVPITYEAGPLPSAQIIETGSDRFVVVFAGQRHGSGLYEIHSDDRGINWSTARLFQRSSDKDLNPGEIRVARDSEGRIHIVWHMDNVSGLAEETWYARLSHDLSTWEFSQKLSQKDYELEFNGHPNIVLVEDELLVVYYDGFPPTRFVRRSIDGGETWSNPAQPFPHIGGYGRVSLVKDHQDTVHMLLGNRLQNPEIHGMWYSRLLGDAWLPLAPVISGPRVNGFDPTRPEAVLVQGNVLLATWSNDVPFLGHRTGAWYSYTLFGAPELAVEPLPVKAPTASSPPADLSTTPASPTRTPSHSAFSDTRQDGYSIMQSLWNNPGSVIFISVMPVIVIILVVFLNRIIQKR